MFKRLIRGGNFPKQLPVVDFKDPKLGLSNLLTRCDQDLGGFSTVDLSVAHSGSSAGEAKRAELGSKQAESGDPATFGVFQGDLSLDLPEDNPDVVRLGYAMFRTRTREPGLFGFFGKEFMDWSPYTQVALRVRGDHRKYFVNVQADTPYKTDLYQHRLFLKSLGSWEVVTIPFANFILTNGGIIQRQAPLDIEHVRSIGIGLIDGQYGPFRLDIDWIKVISGEYTQPSDQSGVLARPDVIGGNAREVLEAGALKAGPLEAGALKGEAFEAEAPEPLPEGHVRGKPMPL